MLYKLALQANYFKTKTVNIVYEALQMLYKALSAFTCDMLGGLAITRHNSDLLLVEGIGNNSA